METRLLWGKRVEFLWVYGSALTPRHTTPRYAAVCYGTLRDPAAARGGPRRPVAARSTLHYPRMASRTIQYSPALSRSILQYSMAWHTAAYCGMLRLLRYYQQRTSSAPAVHQPPARRRRAVGTPSAAAATAGFTLFADDGDAKASEYFYSGAGDREDEEDEDSMLKMSLAEAQETAGFYEPEQRMSIGGMFNIMFFLSTLRNGAQDAKEPVGKL